MIRFILSLILIIIVWFFYPFYIASLGLDSTTGGQFGDSFGALNTLFSGLAFATIIYTIFIQRQQLSIQREELSLQRKELELTREELKRSAEAQEKTEKSVKMQAQIMEISARITAYNSLITSYKEKEKSTELMSFYSRETMKAKSAEYETKLEGLLIEIEKIRKNHT